MDIVKCGIHARLLKHTPVINSFFYLPKVQPSKLIEQNYLSVFFVQLTVLYDEIGLLFLVTDLIISLFP